MNKQLKHTSIFIHGPGIELTWRSLLYHCLASKSMGEKYQGFYTETLQDRWCVHVIIHALGIYQSFYANVIDITPWQCLFAVMQTDIYGEPDA